MDAQERELLATLVNRVLRHPDAAKDSDAERAVQRLVAARSDTPYLLLQRVLVLEAALEQVRGQFQRLREAQAPECPVPAAPAEPGRPPVAGAVVGEPARGFLRDAAVIAAGVTAGSLLAKGVDAFLEDAGGALDVDIDGWL